MAVRNFLQGDRRRYAFFLCKFAAWREWTARNRFGEIRRRTRNRMQGLSFFVERRTRFLQSPITRMFPFVKNLRRGRAFDNSHGIHRQDTTARIGTLPRSFVRSVQTSDARMGSGGNFVSRYPAARLRGRECSDETQAVQSARLMLPVQR